MSSIYVSDPFTRIRKDVTNVDLSKTLSSLKDIISNCMGIQPGQQELIYMGDCLEDDQRTLSSYGIENNVTIFVTKKINKDENDEQDKISNATISVEEVQALLNKAKNPIYRATIKRFLKDTDSVEDYIKNTDIIRNDRISMALLRDCDLLLAVVDTTSAESISKEHPPLCTALKYIVSNTSMATLNNRLQLFQNSGNEEAEYDGIDPALLAQAQMMAANEANTQQQQQQQQQRQSSADSPSTQQQNSRHQISASDLANALSFATTLNSDTNTSTPTSNRDSEAQIEESLQQMRAVGILDDQVSRRALTMSGGDVSAAINLIFEGGLS